MSLPESVEAEITEMAGRYGQPRRVIAELPRGNFKPLTKRDRFGEVCMVVRRPSGHLITAIKTHYPDGAYRLLTGGIDLDESIEEALFRETYEETGLDVVGRRFLAVIEYHLPPIASQQPPTIFSTFAFLLDEVGGTLGPIDEHEQIAGFREILPHELPAMADVLEGLDRSIGETRDPDLGNGWGIFRSLVHRVVYDALMDGE